MCFVMCLIYFHRIFRVNRSVRKRIKRKLNNTHPIWHHLKILLIIFCKVIAKVSLYCRHLILMRRNIERYSFLQEIVDIKVLRYCKIKWNIEIGLLKRRWIGLIMGMWIMLRKRKKRRRIRKRGNRLKWKGSCLKISKRQLLGL